MTMTPVRSRAPWLVLGGAAAVGAVVVLSLVNGRRDGANTLAPVVVAPPPPAVVAPPPLPQGRARIVVTDADSARVFVDGKLIAAGVREAQLPSITAGEPHRLRIEVPERPVYERTFAVAAGAEVELQITTASPEPTRPAPRPGKHRPTTAATTPASPASPRPHHRDGLVGDDIFDKK